MTTFTAGALFSGIGGFCLGFREHNIETAWAVENDAAAVLTYEENLGRNKVLRNKNGELLGIEDVRVANLDLPNVDILHAGFPCQSFSIAGERKGFADPRGQLFFEIIRIIREYGENRPSVLLLENSPNLKVGQGGSWFLQLANEIRSAGYWFRESNAFELDCYDYTTVPQKRKRLFMVAFATNKFRNGRLDLKPPHPGHKDIAKFIDFDGQVEDDSYYLEPDNRYYQMISEKIEDRRAIYQLRKYLVREKESNVCPTLTANMGQGGHNVPFILDRKGLRKLTEFECLALQGFPKRYKFPLSVPRAKRYQQVGNSVVPPLVNLLADAIVKKLHTERIK
ncbi:MAG: DNA (cytosine-5-)-methyltransferase [Polaromonas sp.]|nr:DNA (cytosine-5-)-methyltransferase [Polaromonas sp.]